LLGYKAGDLTVPTTLTFGVSGVDAGGRQWSQQVSVPFYGMQSSSALTVPTTPLTFNYTRGGNTPTALFVNMNGTSGLGFTVDTATSAGGPWLAVTPSSGMVPSSLTVSINGSALPALPAGTYKGTITVTSAGATGSPATIPVVLNVVAAAALTASPSQLNFSYQVGSAAQPVAQVISVSDPSNINFTATSGGSWLSVSPGSGNASEKLSVSVNATGLTANTYNGNVTITANGGGNSQVVPVTLVVNGFNGPSISSIVNAANYDTSGFSPGAIVTIFGNLLGPQAGESFTLNNGGVDPSLNGVTVSVGGLLATPLFVQSGQVNVILPFTLNTSGQAAVLVQYDGLTSSPFNIPLTPSHIQIFTANASGSGPGSILNQDYSVNSATNPAPPGSVVSVYATGAGGLNPAVSAGGVAGDNLASVALPFSATVNGERAMVLYAGSAPGLLYGVDQFNVQLPADVPSGAQRIVLNVGDSTSQSDVTVFVK
jgi:uncharacterized protein (TIGR03437 family)